MYNILIIYQATVSLLALAQAASVSTVSMIPSMSPASEMEAPQMETDLPLNPDLGLRI